MSSSSLFRRAVFRSRPITGFRQPWPRSNSRLISTTAEEPEQTRYNTRRNSMLAPTMLLAALVPVFCAALGAWQVKRLQWKIGLIDELTEKLERAPLTLPAQVDLETLPEYVYRKVVLSGTWDHAHSLLIGPRVREGTHGQHLITPLIRTDGSTVLVDRGFVKKDLGSVAMALPAPGTVHIVGMVRTSQSRNGFTPDNDPAKGVWYWTDVDAMVEYAGGAAAGVQPVFIEAIFEGHPGEASTMISRGEPVGRAPTIDLSNSHLSYAVTWFSLSVFTTLGYARLLFRHGRSGARGMPRR